LENLKVKNVSFIGHAMGGRVGMYTALHRYRTPYNIGNLQL
jgi:hypothetical protein